MLQLHLAICLYVDAEYKEYKEQRYRIIIITHNYVYTFCDTALIPQITYVAI